LGFTDRLADDADKVFLGHGHFEEDLIVSNSDGDTDVLGIVDILSLDTGGMAENEINRGISELADIWISETYIQTIKTYDTITTSSGKVWEVVQRNLEHGMWELRCTSKQTRRRGRNR